jgi:hypothetical protein
MLKLEKREASPNSQELLGTFEFQCKPPENQILSITWQILLGQYFVKNIFSRLEIRIYENVNRDLFCMIHDIKMSDLSI